MIKEMIKHHLASHQDNTGEYETVCNIDFMLDNPMQINVLGKEYNLDRIRMYSSWGDELELAVSDGTSVFENFLIPYSIRIEIISILEREQKEGQLKGWDLASNIAETVCNLLEDRDIDHCFGCGEEMNINCSCMKEFFGEEEEEE